jgi:hypothetical protein
MRYSQTAAQSCRKGFWGRQVERVVVMVVCVCVVYRSRRTTHEVAVSKGGVGGMLMDVDPDQAIRISKTLYGE